MKCSLFDSFFLAGFESSTGYNVTGDRIDQVVATQHDVFLDADYGRLRDIGIGAARDAIRWPLVDIGGRYDFSTVSPLVEASRRHGIEIIYDLFHYGFPADVDLLSPAFPGRFADYCHAVARFIAKSTNGTAYFTPINEPSFFSWAAGEVGWFAPYRKARGFELKLNLLRAAIKGIDAIWDACPQARIVNVDSLCRVVQPFGVDDHQQAIDAYNSGAVFQSWDTLAGKVIPELGGSLRHLDIVGVNYYWTNQWEYGRPGVPLNSDDPRRWSVSQLLRSVWERYGADLVITEIAHADDMRLTWFRELKKDIDATLEDELPLRGVCLYPILGMPEWNNRQQWTRMGVWDLEFDGPVLKRVPCLPMLEALGETQQYLAAARTHTSVEGASA